MTTTTDLAHQPPTETEFEARIIVRSDGPAPDADRIRTEIVRAIQRRWPIGYGLNILAGFWRRSESEAEPYAVRLVTFDVAEVTE